jgi:hypothetical protein
VLWSTYDGFITPANFKRYQNPLSLRIGWFESYTNFEFVKLNRYCHRDNLPCLTSDQYEQHIDLFDFYLCQHAGKNWRDIFFWYYGNYGTDISKMGYFKKVYHKMSFDTDKKGRQENLFYENPLFPTTLYNDFLIYIEEYNDK